MLRILLTNFHPGDGGGHTTYINALVTSSHPQIEMYIAAPDTSKLFNLSKAKGYQPIALDFPGKLKEFWQIILNCNRLRKILKSQKFDIIHCNGSPDHRLVLYVLFFTRFRHKPKIVFTKHNSFTIKNNAVSRLRYLVHTDHVIVVCEKLRAQFLQLGMSAEKVSVIENGVDTAHFRKQHTRHEVLELRRQLGLPDIGKICVSCAGSGLHKGWQYMAKAAEDFSNTYVVVLGSEPSEERLTELFGGIPPSNLIFPGIQSDVRPYLWAADLGFVLSTSVETISFACREMMSAGLPIIVSDFGCLPENISDETGWITEAGSIASVKNALSKALAADLRLMGDAAQKYADEKFRLDHFQSSTLDVYNKLSR